MAKALVLLSQYSNFLCFLRLQINLISFEYLFLNFVRFEKRRQFEFWLWKLGTISHHIREESLTHFDNISKDKQFKYKNFIYVQQYFDRIPKRKPSITKSLVLLQFSPYKGSTKYLFFIGKCLKKNYWIFSQISFFYLKVQSFRLIMENNYIQMAASSGHAVAYTIGPIFKHIDCVQLYFTNGLKNIVL